MKKLLKFYVPAFLSVVLITTASLFWYSQKALAAFVVVQSNFSNTNAVTLTGVTAGNLIVTYTDWEDSTSGTLSVSDGTSTLQNGTLANDPGWGEFAQFSYLLSANSGNKTYTATLPTGGVFPETIVWEISCTGTCELDQQNVNMGTSVSPDSGSITTTDLPGIILGGEGNYSAAVSSNELIAGGAADAVIRTGSDAASGWYKIVAGTTTGSAHATISSATWVTNVISFKQTPSATYDQFGYRFRNDDGNETTATWNALENATTTAPLSSNLRLRVGVNTSGTPLSNTFQLEYAKNGGTWYTATTSPLSGQSSTTIASGDNDAQQATNGTVTVTGTTIGASLDAVTEYVGMRFPSIKIPKGSTVTSAYISVVPSASTEDEPLVTIMAEAADNSAIFTTAASSISTRATTTSVSWSSTNLGANGATYFNSPDLSAQVQAVINRAGWAYNNPITIIVEGGATTTRDLTIESYENAGANPPILVVNYTALPDIITASSTNIVALAASSTTAQLTPPSGKTTASSTPGRISDDTNPMPALTIGANNYMELEWSLMATSSAAIGDIFTFRVTRSGTVLDTYTKTPVWIIGTGIFSGTLRNTDGATALLEADTLKLSVNANTANSTTSLASDGTFQFKNIGAVSGDIVNIWVSGASTNASLVFKYGSSCTGNPDCTGLSLVKNRVVIDSKNGASVTNASLANCDNNSGTGCNTTDIGFTSDSGALNVTFASNSLQINSGAVFAPGGNVTTQRLNVLGTYTGDTDTLTLSGGGTVGTCGDANQIPLCVGGGATFTASPTTTYTSTASVGIMPTTYKILVLAPGSSGSPTYTLATTSSQTLTATNFIIGDGTNPVTVTALTNNPTINIATTTIASSGTFVASSTNISITGNLTLNSSSTWTKGTGTVVLKSGGTQTVTDSNATKQDLGPVQVSVNGTNTTVNMGSSLKMTSLLVDASQIFSHNGSNTLTLTGSGAGASRPLRVVGTFTQSTGTVYYAGTSATDISAVGDKVTYNNLTLAPNAAGSPTYTLATTTGATITVAGNLTLGDGTNPVTVTALTKNPTLSFATTTLASSATFVASSTNISITGDLTLNSSSTWTKGTGTVVFKSGGTQTVTDSNATKQDLGPVQVSVNGTNTNFTQGSSLKVTSVIVDVSQTLTTGANTITITGSGTGASRPLINNGTFTTTGDTVEYTGTSTTDISSVGDNVTYNNLTLDPAGTVTYNLATSSSQTLTVSGTLSIGNAVNAVTVDGTTYNPTINVGKITIAASAIFKAGSGTLKISSSGTGASRPLISNGTFTQSTGTVYYAGTAATDISAVGDKVTYNNLTLAPSAAGSPAYTLATTTGATITVAGNLTLGDGTNPVTVTAATNNPTINIATTTVANLGTFTLGSGTTNLTGNLTLNSGSTWTKGTGTVVLKSGGTQTVTDSNTTKQDLGPVQVSVNGTNTTVNMGSGLNMSSLTIDASQIFSAANTLTMLGDFTNNGTFTANAGTVTFSPTNGATINVTGSSNTDFYNFTGSGANGSATLQFKATKQYGVSNVLTLSGVAGSPLLVRSDTSTSQWSINFTGGSSSLSYVALLDSGCVGGSNTISLDSTITDRGNNASCWSFILRGGGGGGSVSRADNASGGGTPTGGGTQQGGDGGGSGGGGDPTGGGTQQGGGGGGAAP